MKRSGEYLLLVACEMQGAVVCAGWAAVLHIIHLQVLATSVLLSLSWLSLLKVPDSTESFITVDMILVFIMT